MNTAITTKRKFEHSLLVEADKIDATTDVKTYINLLESDPEGKQYLSKKETLRFEKRLGIL